VIDQKKALEIKTMGDKYFKQAQKNREPLEYHLPQISIHCYLLGVDKCVYIFVNKNTDEVDDIEVKGSKRTAKFYLDRAQRLIDSPFPPARVSDNPAFWKCKTCHLAEICHRGAKPEKNCRTCVHSEAVPGGFWRCKKKDLDILDTDLYPECDLYLTIPSND
jgi:hypothetical protein